MSSDHNVSRSRLRRCLIEANLDSRPITVPDTDSLWAPKPSPRPPVLARNTPGRVPNRAQPRRSWSTILEASLESRPITVPNTDSLWPPKPSPRQRVPSPAASRRSWRAIADYLWIGVLVAFTLLVFALVTPWSPYRLYAVRSGSMSPTLKVGDVILVGPPPATLQEGMIVSFQSGESVQDGDIAGSPNELTTHRIVGIIDGNYLQTKGDANEEPDANLVPLDKVKKAFIFRIPYLGYVGHFIKTPLGWLLFIITPASLIIYGEIKNIIAALRPPAEWSASESDHPVGRKTG